MRKKLKRSNEIPITKVQLDETRAELKSGMISVKLELKADLKFEIGSLRSELEVVKTDVKELKSDVSLLQADVKELKSDVSLLQADVKILKLDVKELKSDVSLLQADVKILKLDVKELKKDVSFLKFDLVSFKSEVKSEFMKVHSSIEKLTAVVHRSNALIEEQTAQNRYVLDGYASLRHEQEMQQKENNERFKQIESVIQFKKRD